MTVLRTALIMAGGTGGHIFPGLALAEALSAQGWQVHWLGGRGAPGRPSMESALVPSRGVPFESIDFTGVRGKGWASLAALPWRLLKALGQSVQVLRRVQPDVVVGFGGYVTFPAGLAAVLLRVPLFLHEQNSLAGMANRVLARVADRVFTAFPQAFTKTAPRTAWVGNPLRAPFLEQPLPALRFAGRQGPLKVLVVGGSLGAKALNEVVPLAVARLPQSQRPHLLHQSGSTHIDALRAHYQAAGVTAELTPFIDDTAGAFAEADLVIARAGASTVTELAAVGAAALFVPFPSAVDDHQTHNARFLVDAGAGWWIPQAELTPERLATFLTDIDRSALLVRAEKAKTMQQTQATAEMVRACEGIVR